MKIGTYGEMIRARRKERGMTQVELGSHVGMSGQAISNIERGYTASMTLDAVMKMELALGPLLGMPMDKYVRR